MKKYQLILPFFVFFALLLAAFAYKLVTGAGDEKTPQRSFISLKEVSNIFDPNERFNLIPTTGEQHKIIHVFTTWCGCCKKELPAIKEISATHKMVGLVWTQDNKEAIAWLNQNGNYYANIGAVSDKDIVALGISKTPMTLVVDSSGSVLCSVRGALSVEKFNENLKPCLSE